MVQLMTTRFDVTLWDCGCLTWVENNEYTHLPCGQDGCRVSKVIKEIIMEQDRPLVILEIKRRAES